jgi:hypothetical protein
VLPDERLAVALDDGLLVLEINMTAARKVQR